MPEPLPRVGHIDFLNVLPLAYGYAHGGADGLAIERGVPAVLNSDLIAGRLDVSNVSSILYARHADKLRILRGPCVSRASCSSRESPSRRSRTTASR